MKKRAGRCLLLFLLLLFFIPQSAKGEGTENFPAKEAAAPSSLDAALLEQLHALPLQAWQEAYEKAFPKGETLESVLLHLAKGEGGLSFSAFLRGLWGQFRAALIGSLWRFSRLLLPAVCCGVLERLRSSFSHEELGDALSSGCFLLLAGCMAQDLGEHMALARQAVDSMAQLMQGLFPLLLTLLAAAGARAGAAFFQPAVAAACGIMTELVHRLTLPLAMGSGVTVILSQLSRHMRIGRLGSLLKKLSAWTLGVGFTGFLSVTALRSLGAAAADGVSLRTAKYAVDHFVPVVGGMVADTMDTLVGASLLIQNALGITGLLLLLSAAAGPMVQSLSAILVYRATAALLEPVTDPRVGGCMEAFADLLLFLFAIQMTVGAMFLLLVAQLLAAGNLTVMLR